LTSRSDGSFFLHSTAGSLCELKADARIDPDQHHLQVAVRNGVVHLHGLIINDSARRASIIAAENTAGVKEVHDHLCFVDTWSGFYMESPEDMKAAVLK
jgi:BON domain